MIILTNQPNHNLFACKIMYLIIIVLSDLSCNLLMKCVVEFMLRISTLCEFCKYHYYDGYYSGVFSPNCQETRAALQLSEEAPAFLHRCTLFLHKTSWIS
jgi:hypothetical protein